ncbi:unnamed protein product [Darwinula stevensoni]|uniref:Uncharacterized protein n=1 Tax=Darwinula stevensoni TaxID=69355 RepID=A0A7R9ACH3_9CRUS|nr:unnamed protein product [Darwinula stevensoni]CAG0899811.1 unnamed protein product [Darwinula stevensoni]
MDNPNQERKDSVIIQRIEPGQSRPRNPDPIVDSVTIKRRQSDDLHGHVPISTLPSAMISTVTSAVTSAQAAESERQRYASSPPPPHATASPPPPPPPPLELVPDDYIYIPKKENPGEYVLVAKKEAGEYIYLPKKESPTEYIYFPKKDNPDEYVVFPKKELSTECNYLPKRETPSGSIPYTLEKKDIVEESLQQAMVASPHLPPMDGLPPSDSLQDLKYTYLYDGSYAPYERPPTDHYETASSYTNLEAASTFIQGYLPPSDVHPYPPQPTSYDPSLNPNTGYTYEYQTPSYFPSQDFTPYYNSVGGEGTAYAQPLDGPYGKQRTARPEEFAMGRLPVSLSDRARSFEELLLKIIRAVNYVS